jgi:phage terminase Nu1 subunit (DNA packaging protein)
MRFRFVGEFMGGRQVEIKSRSKTTPKTASKPKAVTAKKPAKKPAENIEEKGAAEKSEPVKVKLVSTEELAQFVGVDPRRIQQLTQEGVIKKEPGNKKTAKYDFVRNVHSLLQYYRQKSDSRRSGDSDEMANEKLKQISTKRKLEELKLAQLEGDLHKAEDIERIIGAMLTRLRINLMAIPMGLAPILRDMDDARDIAEKLDERIRRAMNEIADMDLKKLVEAGNLSMEET